ncbi:hypothetical protein J2Z21_001245 [Streptomyces griseochromogenes]|uniref:Uncharacterized protein n=1 Tax=Streptomyces griseochromogenes TaxID=68214 RepID=A0ABS4LLP7_9ACTN|nr:hypothetical protein [Streptomyces griseochromogenes]
MARTMSGSRAVQQHRLRPVSAAADEGGSFADVDP